MPSSTLRPSGQTGSMFEFIGAGLAESIVSPPLDRWYVLQRRNLDDLRDLTSYSSTHGPSWRRF
jgi:hypothetical protein